MALATIYPGADQLPLLHGMLYFRASATEFLGAIGIPSPTKTLDPPGIEPVKVFSGTLAQEDYQIWDNALNLVPNSVLTITEDGTIQLTLDPGNVPGPGDEFWLKLPAKLWEAQGIRGERFVGMMDVFPNPPP